MPELAWSGLCRFRLESLVVFVCGLCFLIPVVLDRRIWILLPPNFEFVRIAVLRFVLYCLNGLLILRDLVLVARLNRLRVQLLECLLVFLSSLSVPVICAGLLCLRTGLGCTDLQRKHDSLLGVVKLPILQIAALLRLNQGLLLSRFKSSSKAAIPSATTRGKFLL